VFIDSDCEIDEDIESDNVWRDSYTVFAAPKLPDLLPRIPYWSGQV